MLYHEMLYYVILYNVMLCRVNCVKLCHAMQCNRAQLYMSSRQHYFVYSIAYIFPKYYHNFKYLWYTAS